MRAIQIAVAMLTLTVAVPVFAASNSGEHAVPRADAPESTAESRHPVLSESAHVSPAAPVASDDSANTTDAPSDSTGNTTVDDARDLGPRTVDAAVARVIREDATGMPGYDPWRGRVDDALARRASGGRLMLVGGGIALASTLVGTAIIVNHATSCATDYSTSVCDMPTGPWILMAVGGTVGAGMATVGGLRRQDAREDLAALFDEGSVKGYVEIRPMSDGMSGSFTLTF